MVVTVETRCKWPLRHPFAEKVTGAEDCNDGFLAVLGNDGELHLALLDIKNGVRDVALRKDNLALLIIVVTAWPSPTLARNALGIECS